jgi:hypothetical protein
MPCLEIKAGDLIEDFRIEVFLDMVAHAASLRAEQLSVDLDPFRIPPLGME